MSEIVNFDQAKIKHLGWKSKIRDCLDGKITLKPEEIISHLNCDLGKWYYLEGKKQYGHLQPMSIMEIKHEKLHQIVADIWHFKQIDDTELAEDLYFDLCETSDKIVMCLTEAEKIINNKL